MSTCSDARDAIPLIGGGGFELHGVQDAHPPCLKLVNGTDEQGPGRDLPRLDLWNLKQLVHRPPHVRVHAGADRPSSRRDRPVDREAQG